MTRSKARVEFTDADGNQVSAVMWRDDDLFVCEDGDYYVSICGTQQSLKVTNIPVLPDGVGAVIEVSAGIGRRELLVLGPNGGWCDTAGEWWNSAYILEGPFTVLSEGVRL